MIKTIVDRIVDILTDTTFNNNLTVAAADADFQLPRIGKVYRHMVDNISQFPCAFVIYDGTELMRYSGAGMKVDLLHRIYVGVMVSYTDPASIENAVLAYIDALRPTLNSETRNNAEIVDGKVTAVARDPIFTLQNGRYMSGFSMTLEVFESADQEAVS